MNTKTPKFDALLDKVFETLIPHKRKCIWMGEHKHCEGEFEIMEGDIEFLKMLRVPPPNYCPTCRRIRRFAHMNPLKLFKRSCDAPSHSESIISIFSEECPISVFDYEYFISDKFNPFSYGRKYDKNESPFQILLSMRKEFPVPSFLNKDSSSVNSEYSNGGRNVKNGYLAMSCYQSENIWYSNFIIKSKDVMEGREIENSDHLYKGLYSDHIYRSLFIYFSKECTDSMFLFDCRNCDNCFGCVNLRGAKHCVWNKQLSKEEYEKFIKSVYPLGRHTLAEYEKKFWNLVKTLPINAPRNVTVDNVKGVLLKNVRNVYDVTDSADSERVRHSNGCFSHQDSMDVLYSGNHSSLLYSTTNVGGQSSKVKFSIHNKLSTDSEFIFNCKDVHNCFMCFGLQNKSYCVLNIQYSKEEYFPLVDSIKTQMLERGEYGDGLGLDISAQAYNFSIGQITFPLEGGEILKLGGYIAKEPETNAGNVKILSHDEVPQTIEEVSDDIVNHAIKCEVTGKPFRIISSELQFLRKMKMPLPTQHPFIRMQSSFLFVPVGKKYDASCAKCQKSIDSVFDPKNKFIL